MTENRDGTTDYVRGDLKEDNKNQNGRIINLQDVELRVKHLSQLLASLVYRDGNLTLKSTGNR